MKITYLNLKQDLPQAPLTLLTNSSWTRKLGVAVAGRAVPDANARIKKIEACLTILVFKFLRIFFSENAFPVKTQMFKCTYCQLKYYPPCQLS